MSPRPILSLAAGLLLGASFIAPAAAAPAGPSLVDCSGALVSKPKSISISCADGGIAISGIKWTKWDANSAKGTGTLVVNSCIYTGGPTCASGETDSYRASITLGGLASGPSVDIFSQVNLTFPKGGPAGLNSGSYTIDNEIR